ncbi:MAG: DNA primase [Pigmentiphaga sp.]|nr:DNA primase [Pigmentiphaga sp.]
MIPESFIQDLLERVDVADVVGRYVQLRKAGANLLGLCPFHNEKSPSFTVSPTKQFYHCFGCGAHGTAIRFLMEHQGASFPEAVRQLADTVGMVVPAEPAGPISAAARQARAERKERESRHSQVLEAVDAWYRKQLRSATGAIEYLKARGVSGRVAKQYGLGWAGGDRRGLATLFPDYDEPGFAAFLVECGLVIESEDGRRYDRFRQRVMFPIRNARGHLVGFGGRLIAPGEPKYLNSPETPVFSKGHELYGLWEARQAIRQDGHVLVVEGYMDVVALAQMGIGNAVATLGTATTAQHIQKLLRATDQIVFSFDGDKAGRKAAWRALQSCLSLLRDDISIRFLFLPAEHDPDSFVREHGAEAFREAARGAMPLSQLLFDEWEREHDLQHAEGRAHCIRAAQPLLQAMPGGGLRLQIVRELAQKVRLTPDELDPLLQLQDVPSGPLVHAGREAGRPAPTPGAGARGRAAGGPAGEPMFEPDGPPAWSGPFEPHGHEFDAGPGEPWYPEPGRGGVAGGDYGGGRGRGKGREPWRGRGGRFKDDDGVGGFRGRRAPVMAVPARLLRLLLAHPQLVTEVEAEAWSNLDRDLGYGLVLDLLDLLRRQPATHTGLVLQAVAGSPLESELIEATSDLLLMDDLPEPRAELDDTLRSATLQRLMREQADLVARAAQDPEALRRYGEVSKEIARLRQFPG